MNLFPRRKHWYKRRRLPVGILVALVLLAGAAYVVTSARDGTANLSGPSERDTPSQTREEAKSEKAPTKGSDQGKPPPEEPAPDPEQDTPEEEVTVGG